MNQPIHYCINPYVMYLARLLRCQFREALHKEGLFVGQHELLVKLYHHPGHTASQLAKELDLAPATVSVSLKRLEKAGFIQKVPDETDNRITCLYLTEKGGQSHDSVRTAILNAEATLVQGMTEEEIDQFRSYLKRAVTNLGGEWPEHGLPVPPEAFNHMHAEERSRTTE